MHESVVLKTCMDALVCSYSSKETHCTIPRSVMGFFFQRIFTHRLVNPVSSRAGRHHSLEEIRDSLVSAGSAGLFWICQETEHGDSKLTFGEESIDIF